jgi:capsular exopolysaccharide synthesis family protein
MNQQLPVQQVEEIHLQDYINVLLRRKKTFVASFAAVFAGVAIYTFIVPPVYESSTTLFVKDDKGKVGQMGDLLLNSAAPVDSELEILKSRTNAEKVVSRLHLDWQVDDRSPGVEFTTIEFSSSAANPSYRVEIFDNGNYLVKDDGGNILGNGQSGAVMRGKGITLFLKELKGKRGDSFRLTLLPFNQTVANLRQGIRAAEVGKKTNVISVTYRSEDPIVARDVVNAMAQAYLEKGVALKAEEATRTVGFVEEQLKGVKTDLESSEKNLASYKSASGIMQLDAEAQKVISTLATVEKQKAETTLQKKQLELALASLKEARTRGAVYSPAVMRDDPLVAGMASKLSELEVQKEGLLSESTENHPSVRNVQAQIDELQKKIQATYETALKGVARQEESLAREIAGHDAQLQLLPVAERDLARLTRVSKVNADIFTFLLQKQEEARIAQASTISNIKVVDPAIAADRPVSPNKKKNLLLGLIVGLMAGVGLSFFRDYLDDTVKGPEEAKKALALPLLALIPYMRDTEGQGTVSHHAPKSLAAEAFRSLRTALHFSSLKKQKQVMLLTSTLASEGKSTVACNLAITLAQTGASVLLVDCDLRRSSIHVKLGLAPGAGLTELLVDDLPASGLIHRSTIEGLSVLRAGAVPPNPAELLGSAAMASFIARMRELYTFIILDAPPVLAVTDAPVLTSLADLVVLVVENGRVPVNAAKRTREMLLAAAAPLAGIVLSDRTVQTSGSGYGYGYGYGYVTDQVKKPWWKLSK